MTRLYIFDGPHLIDYLENAIARNCQVERRANGARSLCFGGVSDITVTPGLRMMVLLPEQLSDLVYSDNSVAPHSLSRLMSGVAILASHADVLVRAPLVTDQQHGVLRLLRRKITTDFALYCALSVAQYRGYSARSSVAWWDVLHSVLMVKDDDSLRRIFRELLVRPQAAGQPRRARQVQVTSGSGRRLSPQSYWNLMSVADEAGWSDAVCLRLIEEYLEPAPSARMAHYGDGYEVPGTEWIELHGSIFGSSLLCRS